MAPEIIDAGTADRSTPDLFLLVPGAKRPNPSIRRSKVVQGVRFQEEGLPCWPASRPTCSNSRNCTFVS